MLTIDKIHQPTAHGVRVMYRAAYGKHHAWNLCPLLAAAHVLCIAAGKEHDDDQ